MNVSIREMCENDYPDIGGLIKHELGYSDIDFSSLFDRLRETETDDNYMTYVAVRDNSVIGFIGLLKYIAYDLDNKCLRILALAVSEEHQRKGIGRMLLQRAERFAIESNICRIMLTSNSKRHDAHIFYEHHHYIRKSYGFFKALNE